MTEEDSLLLAQSIGIFQETGRISASLLQAKFRIGWPRASRLLSMLESEGLITFSPGNHTGVWQPASDVKEKTEAEVACEYECSDNLERLGCSYYDKRCIVSAVTGREYIAPIPGVYIRYGICASNAYVPAYKCASLEPKYYIGQTKDMLKRYNSHGLSQVFYFELVENEIERSARESELLWEFFQSGLPLANQDAPWLHGLQLT